MGGLILTVVRAILGQKNGQAETLPDSEAQGTPATDNVRALWTRDYKQEPAKTHAAITPADNTNLPGGICRSIYVGGAGDVAIVDSAGNVQTWKSAQAGSVLPIQAKGVNTTNTSATNLLALY